MDREKMLMIVTGVIIGGLAVLLVAMGNPGNMGYCIACFLRDTAGGLGFHRAAIVQYVRPELIGLVLGAFIAAVSSREFKSRGGSSTFVRFLLGIFMMLGALIFLGCPLRDILRIGGGDLNAVVGLAGLIVGILWGIFFLKRGFNLGAARAEETTQAGGYLFILGVIGLLVLLISGFSFNPAGGGPLFFSTTGPGSQHAPLWIALGAGLLVGVLSQKARLCLTGGFRDFFLIGNKGMLIAYAAILITVVTLNLYLGKFNLGFANQPIAHTNHIFNFLGLFLVGQCGVLLGGCPLRQIILGSEGDMDAAATVMGMLAGAAIAHNFMLAATTKGTTSISQIALITGIVIVSIIGWAYREVDA
ncbi:MAG: YedE-related selenium metabolism membrane protein [Firmicutes bacterium HGW-Firmicutes-15]|nr:MAG: YedE-related selenium metabolism membrane protein [Firmicutes bacterium HGW-Firmicutes-15]